MLSTSLEEISEITERFGFHPSYLAHEALRWAVFHLSFAIDRYKVTNREYAASQSGA